jgi:hypothetical protein
MKTALMLFSHMKVLLYAVFKDLAATSAIPEWKRHE